MPADKAVSTDQAGMTFVFKTFTSEVSPMLAAVGGSTQLSADEFCAELLCFRTAAIWLSFGMVPAFESDIRTSVIDAAEAFYGLLVDGGDTFGPIMGPVYSSHHPPWLIALRAETLSDALKRLSSSAADQYSLLQDLRAVAPGRTDMLSRVGMYTKAAADARNMHDSLDNAVLMFCVRCKAQPGSPVELAGLEELRRFTRWTLEYLSGKSIVVPAQRYRDFQQSLTSGRSDN